MTYKQPRLSIGLPVYNGEKYLEVVLDSLIAQTFTDFELIISDNASTDRTAEIALAYQAKDRRIKYFRNKENIGAIQNWYRTFDLSSGEYFAAAAHDDSYAPDYMARCIEVLDTKPEVVVCFSKTVTINEGGRSKGTIDVESNTVSPLPNVRFYNAIAVDYLCIQLYGVMRPSVLRKVKRYTGYYGCDRNTLAELSLLGQIYEIPDPLFFHRLYPQALGAALHSGRSLQELFQLDPGMDWNARFPALTRFANYITAVSHVPLNFQERLRCYFQLIRIVVEKFVNRMGSRKQSQAVSSELKTS